MLRPQKIQKGLKIMQYIAFILEHVTKILYWTNDPEEAAIIKKIIEYIPMPLD